MKFDRRKQQARLGVTMIGSSSTIWSKLKPSGGPYPLYRAPVNRSALLPVTGRGSVEGDVQGTGGNSGAAVAWVVSTYTSKTCK